MAKAKNELEKETRERRAELQRSERRLVNKEESLDKKLDAMERRENSFAAKEEKLKAKTQEVEALIEKQQAELERVSGLTADQAKEFGHSLKRETGYLTVHSVLHLLGYDHMDDGPMKKEMRQREETIMQRLALPR